MLKLLPLYDQRYAVDHIFFHKAGFSDRIKLYTSYSKVEISSSGSINIAMAKTFDHWFKIAYKIYALKILKLRIVF